MARCPRKEKAAFRDRIAAEMALIKIGNNSHMSTESPRRAYPCQCGKWHLTKKVRKGH